MSQANVRSTTQRQVPQTAAVLRAPHRQQRQDAASSQPRSDCVRIVAAVSHHTIWTTARPSPLALEWKNRIHQRQCLLRVVSVGAGQSNRERHTSPVADQMTLAPALGPISGIWTGLVTAVDGPDGTTVHDRPRPVNLIGACQPIQQRKVHQIPNARPLPIAQAPPARHPRPAPSSCGSICQGMPLRRTKTMPVRHARSETRGRPPCGRRGRIGKRGSTRSHNRSGSNAAAIRRSRYFADEDQVREVLLRGTTGSRNVLALPA